MKADTMSKQYNEREVNTLSKDKLVMLKTDVIIKCAFIEMHLKSQKHLINKTCSHTHPLCLKVAQNVLFYRIISKKRLDGVISKDFALIRKLHAFAIPAFIEINFPIPH